MSLQIGPFAPQYRRDLIIALVLMLLAAVGSYLSAQRIDPLFLHANDPLFLQPNMGDDVYFQADLPRVYTNITQRTGNQYRTKVHPLFPMATLPAVGILWKILGIEPLTAVRLLIATIAALWIWALFALLRLLGCHRLDAVLFSLAGMVSAAAIFWFAVPETYSFGSLTILLALVFVALSQYRKFSEGWYVLVSAMTLSCTVTNWMAGIAASLVNLPWRRVVQVTVNAFFVVAVLWAVQKHFVPSAQFLLDQSEERNYTLPPGAGGPLRVFTSFFSHSVVMPAVQVISDTKGDVKGMYLLSIQQSLPGSGGLWGTVATSAWAMLFGLGLWGFFYSQHNLRLRLVIGFVLLGQLGLHLLYGEETFLYSLHFVPLLILIAACSTLTRARWLALPLVGILITSTGINNWTQFNKAAAFFQSDHTKPRADVLREQSVRPGDLWPRGQGHVLLAVPGSREADKSYHEPGGSFSPVVGSFGVSLWVIAADGAIKTTSDLMPLAGLRQGLDWENKGYLSTPSIVTDTPYYRAQWTLTAPDQWRLSFDQPEFVQTKLAVVIRSVGPAGGPIRALDWDGQRLLINDRWQVTLASAPAAVFLGDERQPAWKTGGKTVSHWEDKEGWGYARFDLQAGKDWALMIADSQRSQLSGLNFASTQSAIKLTLPEPRFEVCLNAQVAHLMMSLVGRQTRPADPTNAPIPWQRDEAYIITALARIGQLQIAKELSQHLAENDFYGGFGAEADAPGLALWALKEVAARLDDLEYEQGLWPHVRRKADFILEMLSTNQSIHRTGSTPIVPAMQHRDDNTLVAEPAREGLIIGRMDQHRPVLYVNAVSYRGLMDAVWLAQRLQHREEADRWLAAAVRLKAAWEKAFIPPESHNDRTYISALWPTWVSNAREDMLQRDLEFRWTERRDGDGGFLWLPLWTYFEIAEAHQWLYLGDSDRVWDTLRWFWEHQASPGLYTWWEDEGEGNTFYLWNKVRGWVQPRHVTPHYWTAAEMLLLQLDMLAYVDESTDKPSLVIGAGIPVRWLDQPLRVEGLVTPYGIVSWDWNDGSMNITINRATTEIPVRLGNIFPIDTRVQVKYQRRWYFP